MAGSWVFQKFLDFGDRQPRSWMFRVKATWRRPDGKDIKEIAK
jgi:hypothetical protein